MCWFAGWGKIRTRMGYGPTKPEKLQDTQLKVNSYCGKYDRILTKSSFCAGFYGMSSGCVGDSGGPLICRDTEGTLAVYGVGSWSHRSCSPSSPTGFASLRGKFNLTLLQVEFFSLSESKSDELWKDKDIIQWINDIIYDHE